MQHQGALRVAVSAPADAAGLQLGIHVAHDLQGAPGRCGQGGQLQISDAGPARGKHPIGLCDVDQPCQGVADAHHVCALRERRQGALLQRC